MRSAKLLLAALGLCAGCETAAPTGAAPAKAAAQPAPAAFDAAAADRLLAARRWNELFRLHAEVRSTEDMKRALDWSRDHLMAGGTVFIGLPYAVNLWRVAASAPAGSRMQELKETSATVGLYGLAVILVDGNRCADRSSPGERSSEWIASFREPLRHAAALPQEGRERLVQSAVAMESGIAPRRREDPWLCGAGRERLAAALATMKDSGEQPQEVPTPFGGAGRAWALREPPGWAPSFVGHEQSAADEAAARAALPGALGALLEGISPARAG
jgi:hypothetical protein